MKTFILILLAILGGCTAPNKAVHTLTSHGFTEIETRGHDFFSCSEDDVSATKFTATNPAGKKVSGTVCCGWIAKSCTVRF